MRPSKRDLILDAAVALISEHGLEALSFETLADAAGLSKSGIIYHFPTRRELLLAIHTHFAAGWEAELESLAGAPADQLTRAQRLRAVVVSMARSADPVELVMLLDARRDDTFRSVWADVDKRWMPEPDDLDAYLVQLMAYGLWIHDHTHHEGLSEATRERLLGAVLEHTLE